MTYKINNVTITTQPETGKWVERDIIGRDGNGRPIYPSPREFEMKWGFLSMSEWLQLQTFFGSVGATGTAVVDLPEYGASSYQFRSYSGCILSEPTVSVYFEENVSDVRLLISKVAT